MINIGDFAIVKSGAPYTITCARTIGRIDRINKDVIGFEVLFRNEGGKYNIYSNDCIKTFSIDLKYVNKIDSSEIVDTLFPDTSNDKGIIISIGKLQHFKFGIVEHSNMIQCDDQVTVDIKASNGKLITCDMKSDKFKENFIVSKQIKSLMGVEKWS